MLTTGALLNAWRQLAAVTVTLYRPAPACVIRSPVAALDGSVGVDRRPRAHRWSVERRTEPDTGLMTPAARVVGEVHDAAAFVDADGDRAVAVACGRRERVAAAAPDRDRQRQVGDDVRTEMPERRVQVTQRGPRAACFRVAGLFTCLLPSCGRWTCAGYWQPHVPAPVTSDFSVAFDTCVEVPLELVGCVGRGGAAAAC